MEIKLLLTLDLREQAALQAALVTHGAPDALVTLALTGACRILSLEEARQLRKWLAEARTAGETADHRIPWRGHAYSLEPMDRRFCAATARARLDRGQQRRDRGSLGRRTQRALR